jgi:hypothetical protein
MQPRPSRGSAEAIRRRLKQLLISREGFTDEVVPHPPLRWAYLWRQKAEVFRTNVANGLEKRIGRFAKLAEIPAKSARYAI